MKVINAYSGLGDSVYQRPFIRALSEREDVVYLKTPMPDFYLDFKNVKFIKPKEDYRTQTKQMARHPDSMWVKETPRHFPDDLITIGYDGTDLVQGGIINAYEKKVPLGKTPFIFDLPKYVDKIDLPMVQNDGKPIALVRPVTLRKEWIASARAPNPEYIQIIATHLWNAGYHVVSVADVVPGVEDIVGIPPPAHQKFHNGELSIAQLMSLVRKSAIVVGGVGWITPFTIAAGRPLFQIFGGQGMYNQVSRITDLRMDLSKFGYALPERFCRCAESVHTCPKFIANIDEKFWDFVIRMKRQGDM